jgi:hypothetical protein
MKERVTPLMICLIMKFLHNFLRNDSIEWSEEHLQDGHPLDFEDKWGK